MRVISAIAALTMVAFAGCANRCDYAQVKCQYECKRAYETCQLQSNDEWYCHNQVGQCWSNCADTRAACHSIM